MAGQAVQFAARFPGRAEPLLWQGTVTSEEAAYASMPYRLGLARQARDILKRADQATFPVADLGHDFAPSLGAGYG